MTAEPARPFRVTGTEQKRAWADKVLPPVEQVQQGLWSIPVPIPDNPLRYVLVYALELDDGLALIDAGWDTDDAWLALNHGLATAGHAIGDVRGVMVTHIHPDHYGLAGRIREASGAWVGTASRRRGSAARPVWGRYHRPARRHGRAAAELRGTRGRAGDPVSRFAADRRLRPPDRARPPHPRRRPAAVAWLGSAGGPRPGPSPGHLCFHEHQRRVLFSGDHVFPRVTPNTGVHAQSSGNPLADFVDSLARAGGLDHELDEVLPAHEYRFAGLAARVSTLLGHHDARLEEIHAALTTAPTTWELTAALTWSRPWDQVFGFMRRAAVAETLAHLVPAGEQGTDGAESRDPVALGAALTGHCVPLTRGAPRWPLCPLGLPLARLAAPGRSPRPTTE